MATLGVCKQSGKLGVLERGCDVGGTGGGRARADRLEACGGEDAVPDVEGIDAGARAVGARHAVAHVLQGDAGPVAAAHRRGRLEPSWG